MQENNDLLFSSFDIAYNTPEIYKIRNVQQILKCLTLKYTTIQCIHWKVWLTKNCVLFKVKYVRLPSYIT
jgi:hypothetical protein